MDYKITKDDFYIVSVAIYDDIYKGELIPRYEENEARYAVLVNNILLDVNTGEQILPLETDYNGIIRSNVYSNRLYAQTIVKYDQATDEHLLIAAKTVEDFYKRQELIQQKKLIPLPTTLLFRAK